MAETLRLKTEVEGLELQLVEISVQQTLLKVVFKGEEVFSNLLDRYRYNGQTEFQEDKLRNIFQKKHDPNYNFFDRVIEIVDKHSKKKVLPTV